MLIFGRRCSTPLKTAGYRNWLIRKRKLNVCLVSLYLFSYIFVLQENSNKGRYLVLNLKT